MTEQPRRKEHGGRLLTDVAVGDDRVARLEPARANTAATRARSISRLVSVISVNGMLMAPGMWPAFPFIVGSMPL